MAKGIFITGTGTEVGKTVVTAGILRYLLGNGFDAVPMKPVQTGAMRTPDGRLEAPDLDFHCRAAGLCPSREETDRMAPYCYEPACSPHLAGRQTGLFPDITAIKNHADGLLKLHDALLVEGAGGVMVPLDESRTMLDLMAALAYPVILVAHAGLGTINHTLLSLGALRAAHLEVLGVVFNDMGEAGEAYINRDNPEAVRQFGRVYVLGSVPYLPHLSPEDNQAWDSFNGGMSGLERVAAALHA